MIDPNNVSSTGPDNGRGHGPSDVLSFWFDEVGPKRWYVKDDELDRAITERFSTTYERIVAGETAEWRNTIEGRLAEIIVLDQFARNMFRGQAKAFAADPLALALAQEAIRSGGDTALPEQRRAFLYMPFMHSESRHIHQQAVTLFDGMSNLDFELRHKAIIDRFGRYPHRNAALGRDTTAEERAWMETNSGF